MENNPDIKGVEIIDSNWTHIYTIEEGNLDFLPLGGETIIELFWVACMSPVFHFFFQSKSYTKRCFYIDKVKSKSNCHTIW